MKKLNVRVWCTCGYNSSIGVPDEMTLDEAIKYAKEHIGDIPLGELFYIPESDELIEEACEFDYQELSKYGTTINCCN